MTALPLEPESMQEDTKLTAVHAIRVARYSLGRGEPCPTDCPICSRDPQGVMRHPQPCEESA